MRKWLFIEAVAKIGLRLSIYFLLGWFTAAGASFILSGCTANARAKANIGLTNEIKPDTTIDAGDSAGGALTKIVTEVSLLKMDSLSVYLGLAVLALYLWRSVSVRRVSEVKDLYQDAIEASGGGRSLAGEVVKKRTRNHRGLRQRIIRDLVRKGYSEKPPNLWVKVFGSKGA